GRRSTKCTKGAKSPAAAVMESRKTIPRRARAESSVGRRRLHVRPPLAPLPRAKPPKRERHAHDDPKTQLRKIPALLAQDRPAHAQTPQPRHLLHPRCRRKARTRSAILQAALNAGPLSF